MKPRKMKDSGIPWIGQIPEGWNPTKIKYDFQVNAEKLAENTADDFEFKYIDISSVNDLGKIISPPKMEFQEAPSRARMVVRKGDVIISTVRTYLRAIAQIDENNSYVCSTGFAVLRPHADVDSRFAFYQMQSESIIQSIVSRSVGVSYPAISPSELAATRILHPNIEEQERIAAYLDGKCGEIDRVIAAKERQNELLQAQRAALISETVTKGLNPKAKFKDSGIEWIGKIPEGWRIQRLKTFARINPEILLDNNVFADATSVSFIPMENLRTGSHTTTAIEYSEVKSGYVTFADGDILMAKVTPCFENGNIAIAHGLEHGIGFGSTEILVVRAMDVSRKYLFYYLQDPAFKEKAISEMYGASGLKRLSPTFMENCHYPFPSPHEQEQIAAYLDVRCGEIDRVVAANEGMVAKLKAYRSSVIWEAVTGKVAV